MSARIRTLIVDDEVIARKGLRALLGADPEVEVAGECGDGESALRAIADLAPDVVFLDVQMPELDGFGVLARLAPERIPAVVFVTAYDRYAIRAFDVHALDYLLKPFDDERFRLALERAKAHVREGRVRRMSRKLLAVLKDLEPRGRTETAAGRNGGGARGEGSSARGEGLPGGGYGGKEPRYFDRMAIRSGGRVSFVRVDEIDWIQADDDHVRLHVGPRWHLLRETMQGLERRLNPARFVRIHRSTIVNLHRVKELQRQFHGEYAVVLHDGTELKLSRNFRDNLAARIGKGF